MADIRDTVGMESGEGFDLYKVLDEINLELPNSVRWSEAASGLFRQASGRWVQEALMSPANDDGVSDSVLLRVLDFSVSMSEPIFSFEIPLCRARGRLGALSLKEPEGDPTRFVFL